MSKLVDVVGLSLLWLFCSLPLFTVGASTAALYDAVARCVRGGANGPFARFFRTFRREFTTATIVTVVWGLVLVALGFLIRILWGFALDGSAGVTAAAACSFIFLLIPVGAACWMFPLLSRFTFRPVELILVGLRFALGYLPCTAAIVLTGTAAVLLSGLLWLPVLVLPCLTALFWSLLMERRFRKYMPGEESEISDQTEQ